MKKILIAIGLIFFLILAAIAIFIVTFDADRYKSFFERKLTETLGGPVTIGGVKLAFRDGLAMEVSRIRVGGTGVSDSGPAVRLEQASFMVRFAPLLRRSLEIGAVKIVKPELCLTRYRDGSFGIDGLKFPEGKTGAASPQPGFSALSLLIDALRIEDGNILVRDESREWFAEIPVQNLNVELENLSVFQPVRFRVRAKVFGTRRNVDCAGRFRIPAFGRPFALEDIKLEIDFDGTDPAELFRNIPSLSGTGLREGLGGLLTVQAEDLEFPVEAFSKLKGQVGFRNGKVSFSGLESPIDHIDLDAVIRDNEVRIEKFSSTFSEGNISISGKISHPETLPATAMNISAAGVKLDPFFRPSAPKGAGFRGRLSVSFQGTAEGFAWPRIAQTLSGEGRLGLEDGVILNFNILREVFYKLSFLPGLVETLLGRLSPSDKMKIQVEDTVLKPVDFPVTVKDGSISTDRLRLATDTLEMTGSADLSFDGMLVCQSMLRIYPGFSKALAQSVNELEYFLLADGWLGFPVKIQGKINHPSFIPDVNYIGMRLAVNKTQEVLGGLLEKAFSKGDAKQAGQQTTGAQAAQTTGTGTSSGKGFPYEELLNALFEPDRQNQSKGQ
ncbi:MAG TPA: AsmA family protein [Candidatus Omnitrophota bacterium]|nr:AsmA family protein [Candidatus Omnitrophota bacterium]